MAESEGYGILIPTDSSPPSDHDFDDHDAPDHPDFSPLSSPELTDSHLPPPLEHLHSSVLSNDLRNKIMKQEKPYDKDDDILKATSFEVISTLRDVLKTSALWRDHARTYTQHIGDFTNPRGADFGAAISGANKLQCQQVLEELDLSS